ncbi:hypothetical protein XCV4106 [Xanthomonas euvesicatoria pv. vesicatoria str. 85-10]|uniref:Uncharacterized protein n=1 Tax=Xanthomonas euvesicatoria pv. vesicatoria (strain 85-10) TaxID=316273 RepID=Q3BN26_XANE5|nr:hypothetical protein XCV4106 [Xanthomonas euvesicatoria pv. vesicatoria str. 85-10]
MAISATAHVNSFCFLPSRAAGRVTATLSLHRRVCHVLLRLSFARRVSRRLHALHRPAAG